jgi:P4 family phage/plasmid primase-like protien
VITKAEIDWYLSRDKRLCLLDGDPKLPLKLRGKSPMRKSWTTRVETEATLTDHALSGKNLGFVLGASDLIIDIDPRNGGLDGLQILERDLGGVDIRSLCPTVETGGGGIHFYFSKSPADQIRRKSARYKGVDFLTQGAHVVIPGSFHFLARRHYAWDELSAYEEKKFPPVPEAILANIRRVVDADTLRKKAARSPELTDDELAELLETIDPTEYRNRHDAWLSLMFACHHATGGDGRRAFADWCVRDPQYRADEGLILHRWDSVLDDEENLITYRTLLKAVRDAGGEISDVIERKCKIADFDAEEYTAITEFDDVVRALDDDLDDLGPVDDDERAKALEERERVRKQHGQTKYEALMSTVTGLTHDTVSSKKIEKIAKLCQGFDQIEVDKIQAAVCKYAKLSAVTVRKAFVQTWRDAAKRDAFDNIPKDIVGPLEAFTGDIVPVAVASILKRDYRHGHTICKGQDGAVYVYDGKIWAPLDNGQVDGITREALALADPTNKDVAKHMPKCRTIMMSVLRTVDFTDVVDENYDVFNFQNCEVWIDSVNGKRIRKPHSFKSFQTAVLPYDFDASATCPVFAKALPEILACYGPDAGACERHLWELFGYTLTRRKNVAAFVALTGPGGNGKSKILDALTGVLGGEKSPYAFYGSLADFGSGKSAHAFSQLVGKVAFIEDDAEYGCKLPNEVLKKISENKTLTANPKYKSPFSFENRAICWLASNSWPYTGDTSNGIRRRAHIFHLTRDFREEGNEDGELGAKIRAEAPGIFNAMIRGLVRFRKRGRFLIPPALQQTAVNWEAHTNPIAAFLVECEIPSNAGVMEIYDSYKNFCFESGRGDKISRPRMGEMLESLGCRFVGGRLSIPTRLKEARKEFLQKQLEDFCDCDNLTE